VPELVSGDAVEEEVDRVVCVVEKEDDDFDEKVDRLLLGVTWWTLEDEREHRERAGEDEPGERYREQHVRHASL